VGESVRKRKLNLDLPLPEAQKDWFQRELHFNHMQEKGLCSHGSLRNPRKGVYGHFLHTHQGGAKIT
jgi:hypothetical protein